MIDGSIAYSPYVRPGKTNQMDPIEMQKWIDAHDAGTLEKEIATCLVEVIEHVSQKTLEEAFSETLAPLLTEHKNYFDHSFAAVVDPQKSSKWMTDLAQEILSKSSPDFSIPRIRTVNLGVESGKIDTAFIFEDGIFSGEQIYRVIQAICKFSKPKKIVLACPFITSWGEKIITQASGDCKVSILILPHRRIKTVHEALTTYFEGKSTEEIDALLTKMTKMYWEEELSELQKSKSTHNVRAVQSLEFKQMPSEKAVRFRFGPKSRGVVYFDHKVPDVCSFPEAIRQREVKSPLRYHGKKVRIIPITIPPYKSEG